MATSNLATPAQPQSTSSQGGTTQHGELSPLEKVVYIVKGSIGRNLDPAAVISVALQEGGFHGAIGDSGTSFGPFQLHINGALPQAVAAQGAGYAQYWANSPAGIDYALSQIQKVAGGKSGGDAVARIVYSFERPHDPGSEAAAAANVYPRVKQWLGSNNLSAIAGGGSNTPGAIGTTINTPAGNVAHTVGSSISSIGDAFGWFFDNWDRVLEVFAGGVFVVIGGLMLGRQMMGHNTDLTKLLSKRQVSGGSTDSGSNGGSDRPSDFELGQMYAEEKTARAAQKASDRRAIRANRSSATRGDSMSDEVPF